MSPAIATKSNFRMCVLRFFIFSACASDRRRNSFFPHDYAAPLPISCNVGVASGFRFFAELAGWPPTLQSMGEGAHNHEGRISSAYRLEVCCFSLP